MPGRRTGIHDAAVRIDHHKAIAGAVEKFAVAPFTGLHASVHFDAIKWRRTDRRPVLQTGFALRCHGKKRQGPSHIED